MGNENSQQVKLGESIENDINITWKKSEREAPFPARDGHCAASVGKKVYFFGGVISVDADGYETNELIAFDIENGSWSKVATKGDTPPARFAATMSAVGTSLFLFGGLSQDSGWFDDVHKFNTETQTWSVVQAEGEAPSPRDKLSSTVIDKDIYVFGGFGPQAADDLEEEDGDEEWEEQDDTPQDQQAAQFGWFDDLYVFKTDTNTWSNPMQMNLQKPTPRAAMAMCAVDKYICIFGGRDSEARRNDIHIFNTVSRKWESLSISGRLPEPRSFHTATTVGKRVVVLGGRGTANQHFDDFNIFDVDTMQWLQPVVQGTKPAARGVHTATVVGDQLIVFGGSSEFNPDMKQCLKYFNDLHHTSLSDVLSGAAIEKENQENISDHIQKPDTKAVHKSPAASPKGNTVCLYYNTPGGCRFGRNCLYKHTKQKPPQCRYYGTLGGCRYGDRCMYSHDLSSADNTASTVAKNMSALDHTYSQTSEEDNALSLTNCKESKLTGQNVGYQMLKKMGWSEGQGLGANGIKTPVKISDVKGCSSDIEHLAMKLPTPDEKKADTANRVPRPNKRKVIEPKCGWCPENIKSPDMRTALCNHYRQELLKQNPKHLQFVNKHEQFNDQNIACRVCSRVFERMVDFLRHTKSKIENDKNPEDQMIHSKLIDVIVVPFVENDLGVLDDREMCNRLMLMLLTSYYSEDEDANDSCSDRLLQVNRVNKIEGEVLQKKIEKHQAQIDEISQTWRFGLGGCASDSDVDSDDGYLGFSNDDIMELWSQGIKPWESGAADALSVIYGCDDFYF